MKIERIEELMKETAYPESLSVYTAMMQLKHELDVECRDRQKERCTWHDNEDCWDSDCGVHWVFNDGGPEDNGMVYCLGCGKIMEVING